MPVPSNKWRLKSLFIQVVCVCAYVCAWAEAFPAGLMHTSSFVTVVHAAH